MNYCVHSFNIFISTFLNKDRDCFGPSLKTFALSMGAFISLYLDPSFLVHEFLPSIRVLRAGQGTDKVFNAEL